MAVGYGKRRVSQEDRWRIYNLMILQRWSPHQVWQALFSSGSALVTLKHVVGRLRFFRSKGVDKIATYLYSSPSRDGRPQTMDAGARGVLRAIIAENSGFTDVQIAEKLSELMIGLRRNCLLVPRLCDEFESKRLWF